MEDLTSSAEAISTRLSRQIDEVFYPLEYRLGDVNFYPIGNRLMLIYDRNTTATQTLHAELAHLLASCNEFKTLDEHLYAYCQRQQVNSETLKVMRCKLLRLAHEGFLISTRDFHNTFQKVSESTSLSPITSIVFPTGNRVEVLQQSLTSYLEHCQHFGRTLDFIIADNSMASTTRDAYRQMLHTLRVHYGVNIFYAGLEEKMAFVKRLSQVGNIPEEVVSWACIGDPRYDTTAMGANRNTLLLHTVEERIFCADDSIICRAVSSPDYKDGLVLSSRGNPSERWFYQDWNAIFESVHFTEQDILTLHEQWLGQDPKAYAGCYSRIGSLSLEQAEPKFLHRLAMRPGRIAVTTHGIMGNRSWDKTEPFLQFGKIFEWLMSSEQVYHLAQTSQEMAYVPNQITITDKASPFIGMCIGGLDNRDLLPPFLPLGQADDTIFGTLLTKCFPDIYTVYHPWLLLYNAQLCTTKPTLNTSDDDWLSMCFDFFDPGGDSVPTNCLYKLGQHLEEIGHYPVSFFTESVRQHLWRKKGEFISAQEERLQILARHQKQFQQIPKSLFASWQHDVETYLAQTRQNMLLPIELILQKEPEQMQYLLVQSAQILKWWPKMVEAARHLREEGYHLAQPI